MAKMNGVAKMGQICPLQTEVARDQKGNSLLLHSSNSFVFLITPLMHEYILIIKDFLNMALLRANPEMTPVVCYSYFHF